MSYPVWPDQNADALERELLETWQREGLFRQTLEATRDGVPFVFYEGPPTANGRPGIHHVFSRAIKDLVCRFHAMQGRSITRIAGWDTHGLPVEIEVEKELALNGKQAIEEFGVAAFNDRARSSVFRYKQDWEDLSNRIGFWLDYDRPYITLSPEYIESVWWLLRRLHQRDLLYRGHKVLPYCPRCGTALSSHELALGYQDVVTNSIYVTFPLEDGSGRELLVWTTTPWTLLSNVAVAVHAELEYGEYDVDGRRIVLATSRAALPSGPQPSAPTFAELGATRVFPGRELMGLRYRRPLDVVPLPTERESRIVIAAEFVTADDGSGIVHLAPAFGADDFDAGRQHELALVRPVAADGTFEGTTWPEVEGLRVTDKATGDLILRRLKADGRWHLTAPHRHSYPHCWRCQSPLIYYARDSWFVRTSALKARLLQLNSEIHWHPPEVGTGRFGEWLENNVDWALSRDRYWGTPLPVWVCDADPEHVTVIGSYAELAASWGRALPADFDPHKPGIDAYTWACDCGGTFRRSPEVIDTWFDSGSMPYAQWHYPFEHERDFQAHFPADFICEAVDQTRGWFYSLLAIATGVFDAAPYRHVIVNELVLDASGQKMSKSRGNAVDPWEAVTSHGADAVRLYLVASSQVWLPKRFDEAAIGEVAGNFLDRFRNTYTFFRLYVDAVPTKVGERTLSDQWILSRLAATISAVREAWSAYDVTTGTRAIMEFVTDDVANWYVRTNRPRFWAPDAEPDAAAAQTLHTCLETVARLVAPAAPFVSDWIYRALVGRSVHLAPFPDPAQRNEPLEVAMDAVRRLATLARSAREGARIKVRQPLASMQVAVPGAARNREFDMLLPILADEVNVRAIELVSSDDALVRLNGRPNFRALGQRYAQRTPVVARAVAALDVERLRTLEAGETIEITVEGEPCTIGPEDLTIEREVTSDWIVQSQGPYVVALDPHIDEGLRAEGWAREVVSVVQRLRKEAGYDYTTRITLRLDAADAVMHALQRHREAIGRETLAREVEFATAATAPEDVTLQTSFDATPVSIGVRRHVPA